MAHPDTPSRTPVAGDKRHSRRWRRFLRLLPTMLIALGWLLYPATWFIHLTDTEFAENPNWSTAYPVAARLHHLWTVGNGFVYLNSPSNPIPAGSPPLDYPDHFAQLRKAGSRYRLTLIAYAWPGATTGILKPPLTFAHEFTPGSPEATPHLLGALRIGPEFDPADLWRWEWERRNGILITFPLWAPLLIPTLAMTPVWIGRWRKRTRLTRGLCMRCGYSRAGIDDAAPCPECGGSTSNGQIAKGQMAK